MLGLDMDKALWVSRTPTGRVLLKRYQYTLSVVP
jgi:hypothetical protein